MSESGPTLITSVRRALQIVECVADEPVPPTPKQIASRTRIPLPTVYHLVRTLVHDGYLDRSPSGGYCLSSHWEELTDRGRLGARTAQIDTILAHLRDEVGRAAYLSTLIDGRVTVTAVSETYRWRAIDQWIAFEDVPHATALGKATLSALPASQRREVLAAHRLRRLTVNTRTTPSHLLEEVANSGGCCVDREEYSPGIACAGVAVTAPGAVGAVAVSMPASQLTRLDTVLPALKEAAARISRVWAF